MKNSFFIYKNAWIVEWIKLKFGRFKNKTAGYKRLPSFCKEGFWNDKNVFFSRKKNTLYSSFFLNLPTFKVFWFFAKKTLNWVWNDIFKKQYHLMRILQQICHRWRFWKIQGSFGKTHLFFQKRPKFRKIWEILLFQSHSTANLLQYVQKREKTCLCDVMAWTQLANIE